MGKVITITSRKGGVGKTTNLLNLAGIYSNLEKKVLILDLDLYSSAISISLNLKNKKTINNLIMDISNNKFNDINNYLAEYNNFIKVLPSVNDPRIASQIEKRYIEQIINLVKSSFDVILIDTSHVLSDLNLIIYDNSDTILNIMSNDPIDLVNTRTFVNIANDIEFSDLRILLNESNSLEEKYFSLYDIRSFLNYNVSYKLGRDFFIKSVDKYVIEGKILTLSGVYKNSYNRFEKIALDLLKDKA